MNWNEVTRGLPAVSFDDTYRPNWDSLLLIAHEELSVHQEPVGLVDTFGSGNPLDPQPRKPF